MNELAKLQNKEVTMSSLDIVKMINENRKDGDAELRHDSFMAKVPKVLGESAPKFYGTAFYTNGTGAKVERAIYNFPKREACLMAMSYSYELQSKVYDKMTQLEQAVQKFILPTTMSEALRLSADLCDKLVASEIEKTKAIETKAEIGSRREAKAMNLASQEVKRCNHLTALLNGTLPSITIKTNISELVRSYAIDCLENDFGQAWRTLYREFRNRYHVDIPTRALHCKMSAINYAEKEGYLPNVYKLAMFLYRKEKVA